MVSRGLPLRSIQARSIHVNSASLGRGRAHVAHPHASCRSSAKATVCVVVTSWCHPGGMYKTSVPVDARDGELSAAVVT